MENDLIFRQFEEIEQKVGKLIDASKAMEAANAELKKRVEQLEQELQNKLEEEKRYQDERILIRTKVDGLLSRLEELSDGQ